MGRAGGKVVAYLSFREMICLLMEKKASASSLGQDATFSPDSFSFVIFYLIDK